MLRQIKNILKYLKEVVRMLFFKEGSRIVESYVILILAGRMEFSEVPNLFNLRDAVSEALVK